MAHGTVDWFQIDTDDPESTKRFYGELFNWTFGADPSNGDAYQLVTAADSDRPQGGVADTRGESANGATFFVVVSDVAAAAKQAEELGGKVVIPPKTTPNGLSFAHLRDPHGNDFGVYTPPAG
ncbi:VOC family protein [Actinophytocola sp.]|uniref:VOC family protein n=1 Tax=Actinophytocola sp. TaxID=1872138 RepID=UPI002D727B5E|nr:VOC family protein [Actinophytocola sp.]HYQ65932.1 VOC family protein [Actinophytocola sp.]